MILKIYIICIFEEKNRRAEVTVGFWCMFRCDKMQSQNWTKNQEKDGRNVCTLMKIVVAIVHLKWTKIQQNLAILLKYAELNVVFLFDITFLPLNHIHNFFNFYFASEIFLFQKGITVLWYRKIQQWGSQVQKGEKCRFCHNHGCFSIRIPVTPNFKTKWTQFDNISA